MNNFTKFWMVHLEDGESPRFRYESYDEAKEEAERLVCVAGKTVYILEAIRVCSPPPGVTWWPLAGETP